MKRYIGLTELEDGTLVGIECRAKSEKQATATCVGILDAMMPNEGGAVELLEVSRLKQDKGVWRPVNKGFAKHLFDVDIWLSPKDLELTDFSAEAQEPKTGGQIVPFVPAGGSTTPAKPAQTKTKAATYKPLDLGFTPDLIKAIGWEIRNYDTRNEVIHETGN